MNAFTVTYVCMQKSVTHAMLHAGSQKANNTKALFLLYIDAVSIMAKRSSAMRAAKRNHGCFKCADACYVILPFEQHLHLYLAFAGASQSPHSLK